MRVMGASCAKSWSGRIAEAAIGLLGDWARYQSAFSIRLVGVGMSGLEARPDPEELID